MSTELRTLLVVILLSGCISEAPQHTSDTGNDGPHLGDASDDTPDANSGEPDTTSNNAIRSDAGATDAAADPDLPVTCDTLPDPVAYWRMESISPESEIANEVGAVPIVAADANIIDGAVGNALQVQTGSVCVAADHDALHLETGTIAFWFRVADPTLGQTLLSKDAAGATPGHLQIEVRGGGGLAHQEISEMESTSVMTSPTIRAGNWHHLVYVWSSDGTAIYLDGSTNMAVNDSAPPGLTANSEPVAVGFSNGKSAEGMTNIPEEHLTGAVDELAFFDTRLTRRQIDELGDCGLLTGE